jgi:hypothetical protein
MNRFYAPGRGEEKKQEQSHSLGEGKNVGNPLPSLARLAGEGVVPT